ncbi:hypothetical protein Bhyg_07355 [Pseudolycoriella hygida]|uniref:Uncharacterized protein n=1 Tax=Pseudolycoriella hygida TaxID=35572 RepID=A0A9Q0N3I1_9DIPT|nr:hypothetical protein Bhyg_07355 [Pseudolycoriella hygida]
MRENQIFHMPVDEIAPVYKFDRKFRIIPSREEWNSGSVKIPTEFIIFFTDGSRCYDSSGAGVHSLLIDQNLSIPLGKYATVFQSEVEVLEARIAELEEALGRLHERVDKATFRVQK